MDIYSAKVRLAGSILHEVNKPELTTPEIHVLRRLHGSDGVVDVELVRQVPDNKFDQDAERVRLSTLYDPGLNALDEEARTSVRKLFGEGFTPLPSCLPEFKGKKAPKARKSAPRKPHPASQEQLEALM